MSICALCRTAPANEPWTTCTACAEALPDWLRPPTLSPAGRKACLDLRDRILSGEYLAEDEPREAPEPRQPSDPALTGIHIPGVGLVGVGTESVTSSRVRAVKRRRR